MVTYLSKLCPNLSTLAAPLRDMTRKECEWTWDETHRQALRRVKEPVSSTSELQLFDPNKPVKLSVDASQYRLGACIMHDEQPIEYASKTLTETQKRYVQIETEMLAIQFGLARFHQYIYGQSVLVQTDHKPLLGIMRKPITDISPRLQRMRLQCLHQDFQLIYKPGNEFIVADTLSRAQLNEEYEHDNSATEQIHALCEIRIPSELQRNNVTELTKADMTLQALITMMKGRWPDNKRVCPDVLKSYWNVRDSLVEYEGIVF